MKKDIIIIGAGASGLFAAASFKASAPGKKMDGLILEKTGRVGTKLLMTGGGQCNLTHSGEIKDFLSHYGQQGKAIRKLLYSHNNIELCKLMAELDVEVLEQEDGKVFPASLRASQVRDALLAAARTKGFELMLSTPVDRIIPLDAGRDGYTVFSGETGFSCKHLIIASGGCSYPQSGSDGSVFPLLEKLGIPLNERVPALAPILINTYPYQNLSGISVENVEVSIRDGDEHFKSGRDAILFAHKSFSGPLILDMSRYARAGAILEIDYLPEINEAELIRLFLNESRACQAGTISFIQELLSSSGKKLAKRFLEALTGRIGLDNLQKVSSIAGSDLKKLAHTLKNDSFIISGTGGFGTAMVTRGGVKLDAIHLKTMESRDWPGLYIIGEALDIDGDCGGYNLQFAFSSASAACRAIESSQD